MVGSRQQPLLGLDWWEGMILQTNFLRKFSFNVQWIEATVPHFVIEFDRFIVHALPYIMPGLEDSQEYLDALMMMLALNSPQSFSLPRNCTWANDFGTNNFTWDNKQAIPGGPSAHRQLADQAGMTGGLVVGGAFNDTGQMMFRSGTLNPSSFMGTRDLDPEGRGRFINQAPMIPIGSPPGGASVYSGTVCPGGTPNVLPPNAPGNFFFLKHGWIGQTGWRSDTGRAGNGAHSEKNKKMEVNWWI
jgi:hypothetical protein